MRTEKASYSYRRPYAPANTDREILPANARPVHYELRFEPDLHDKFDYEGSVVIDLYVVQEITSITLNAADLVILKTELFDVSGKTLEASKPRFDKI